MSVVIRLKRMGANKKPFNRIVVMDSRCPRDGRYIENLGTYDPLTEPATSKLDLQRAAYWISKGARPSLTVSQIIKKLSQPASPQPAGAASKSTGKKAAKQKASGKKDVKD